MKEFFNASQKSEETVTSFGCRLEAILEQAFEGGHLPRSAKNELMCKLLWSGLPSEALKSSTWHKLDSSQQYDQLQGISGRFKENLSCLTLQKLGPIRML
ncbi:hypothetical protein DPMN_009650 [Dreissena polymorpha]|uniref:Uncharacterized protein n=1 Tax=Dreissena polymorpha TaxID=45954 RepID=A0A9D4N0P5_DREPO|nr:hypothetical protein DPMN_009650 [Dreissena polymorpha]